MHFLLTTIAQSAAEMESMAPLWNRLLLKQAHSVFQRFTWNKLAAHLFADRLRPYVVCVESDAGAAIIPAVINEREQQIEILGEALFDYRDVLHTGGAEVLQVAWQHIARLGLPLSICCVANSEPRRWPGFPLQQFCTAPEVSRETIDEQQFRSAHSRLGRHFRRLQKKRVTLQQFQGSDSEMVRQLYQRKAEQFPEDVTNVFRDSLRREFMVAICGLEESICDVFTLQSSQGELIAGVVSFRDENIRRFYTIYFDPAWARFSPGVVLLYEVTARSLADGLSCDYMTGEYPYKLRFANSSRALFKLQMSASELADRIPMRENVA